MKTRIIRPLCCLLPVLLASCSALQQTKSQPDPPAFRPVNPRNVSVKVSLSKMNVYVMEGDRPLLAAATAIGKPDAETQ